MYSPAVRRGAKLRMHVKVKNHVHWLATLSYRRKPSGHYGKH